MKIKNQFDQNLKNEKSFNKNKRKNKYFINKQRYYSPQCIYSSDSDIQEVTKDEVEKNYASSKYETIDVESIEIMEPNDI